LEDSIDFQLAIGKERIEERMRALAGHFRQQAGRIPGVELYTSSDQNLSAGMTSLRLRNVPPKRLREYLRQRHDVYVAGRTRGSRYPADPHGVEGIRVSTHYYNTFENVNRVLQALEELSSRNA
jgi:cysteine desulfurase/selenocysteine lyase